MRADQAEALGDRDEQLGARQAARRMVPAHQRLDAGDLAALRRRSSAGSTARARSSLERAGAGRSAARPARARRRPCAARRTRRSTPPARLARVHRGVGVGDQLVARRRRPGNSAMPIEHDSRDRRGSPSANGCASACEQPLRHGAAALGAGHRFEQQQELVAADARHRVGRRAPARAGAAPTSRSTASPAAWPNESLTGLKPSRSMNSTATRRGLCGPRAAARWCSRSSNSSRFGQAGQRVAEGLPAQLDVGFVERCRQRAVVRRLRQSNHALSTAIATASAPTEAATINPSASRPSTTCPPSGRLRNCMPCRAMAWAPARPMPNAAMPAAACQPASSLAWPAALCDHHCVNNALAPSSRNAAVAQNVLHDAQLAAGRQHVDGDAQRRAEDHAQDPWQRPHAQVGRRDLARGQQAGGGSDHADAPGQRHALESEELHAAQARAEQRQRLRRPQPGADGHRTRQHPAPTEQAVARARSLNACVNTPAVSKDTSVASNSSKGRASTSITAAWRSGRASRTRIAVDCGCRPRRVGGCNGDGCHAVAQPVSGEAPPAPGVLRFSAGSPAAGPAACSCR